MSDQLMLGAYWGARREDVDQCADRLMSFIRELSECHDVFDRWYRRGRSRREALAVPVDVDKREQLANLLEEGRNRRDVGQGVIEELGFRIGLWNGEKSDKAVGLSITCGLFAHIQAVGWNCINLDFPEDLGELADWAKASSILAIVAKCWEPDWAGIFSNEAMNSRDWERKPFVDWMVYVPQEITSVPPPSTVTHLGNGGSLVVVQPNPPAMNNPEDQERIRRIKQIVRP